MAILPIVLFPDPVLLEPTRPVGEIDDEIRQLVSDMEETMYAAPGVGLAANQVGVGKRLCLVNVTAGEDPSQLMVLIDPVIHERSGQTEVGEEGCLSFPDVLIDVHRSLTIEVEATDLEGNRRRWTEEGFTARVIQHEVEHLDGKVFIGNISPLKREMIKRKIKKRIEAGDWESAPVS